MKRLYLAGSILLLVWGCSHSREATKTTSVLKLTGGDSISYELLIIDPEFDNWYLLNFGPAKDLTDEYYHGKNIVAVNRWNDYYRRGIFPKIVDCLIDYQPGTDYGIEVNRKLYWYFKYISSRYDIPLV